MRPENFHGDVVSHKPDICGSHTYDMDMVLRYFHLRWATPVIPDNHTVLELSTKGVQFKMASSTVALNLKDKDVSNNKTHRNLHNLIA